MTTDKRAIIVRSCVVACMQRADKNLSCPEPKGASSQVVAKPSDMQIWRQKCLFPKETSPGLGQDGGPQTQSSEGKDSALDILAGIGHVSGC
jgi:hypothetical protein